MSSYLLLLILVKVCALTVLFVLLKVAPVNIAVIVYHLSKPVDLVVLERPFVRLIERSQFVLSLSLLFASPELTDVHIASAVGQSALSLEFVVLELSHVSFAVERVSALAMLEVVFELTLIGSSSCFSENTSTVLLALSELSFVNSVLL